MSPASTILSSFVSSEGGEVFSASDSPFKLKEMFRINQVSYMPVGGRDKETRHQPG